MYSRNCKTCEVCGLRSGRAENKSRIFMANFPLDENRCKLWVRATGKSDLVFVPIEKLHSLKHICEQHFNYKDFNRKKNRLRKTAVPVLKLNDLLPIEMLDNFPCHVATREHDRLSREIGKHNVSAHRHEMQRIALSQPSKETIQNPGNEHDYSRKIRLDHTYCEQKPQEISGASRYSNVCRSKNLKSEGQAHPIVTGNTSTRKDAVDTSWSPEPFDYGESAVNSSVSVKSESAETAEEWYREAETRVCRVCVRVSDDVADMEPLMRHGAPTSLARTMQRLLPDILISLSDVLPKQLCRACADEALRAERFLQQALHTQQRLSRLAPAAVAEDVFQNSLMSRYLSNDTMAPHVDIGDVFVTLRFDGENLELESSECVKDSVKEVIHVEEKACTTGQTSDTTEAFEECEVFAESYEEVVIQSFEDDQEVVVKSFEDDQEIVIQSIEDKMVVIQSLEDDDEVVIQSIEDDEQVVNQSIEDKEVVSRSFKNAPSPDAYGDFTPSAVSRFLSGSHEDAQPLELPSIQFKRRRLEHPNPSFTTGTCMPSNPHNEQALVLPPFKRRRRKSPLSATSFCVSESHEREQLNESFTQRLCEPTEYDTSPDAS